MCCPCSITCSVTRLDELGKPMSLATHPLCCHPSEVRPWASCGFHDNKGQLRSPLGIPVSCSDLPTKVPEGPPQLASHPAVNLLSLAALLFSTRLRGINYSTVGANHGPGSSRTSLISEFFSKPKRAPVSCLFAWSSLLNLWRVYRSTRYYQGLSS